VLLIDDLYQSGASSYHVAMLMLETGAKKVFGLACEKTCRNDDKSSQLVLLEKVTKNMEKSEVGSHKESFLRL